MKVHYHPDFPRDIRKFFQKYREIYPALGERFLSEIDIAIADVIAGPDYAGHFVRLGTRTVRTFRRRNLDSFPFFVLYGHSPEHLIFGSLVPSRSDPLDWLSRFRSVPA